MVDFKKHLGKPRREEMSQEDKFENTRRDPKIQKQWVNDCLLDENRVHLTEWELNFCRDIRGHLLRGRDLTDKQLDTLERIYSEKTQ